MELDLNIYGEGAVNTTNVRRIKLQEDVAMLLIINGFTKQRHSKWV